MPKCVFPAQLPCPNTEEKEEPFTIQDLPPPLAKAIWFHLFCLAPRVSFEQSIHTIPAKSKTTKT